MKHGRLKKAFSLSKLKDANTIDTLNLLEAKYKTSAILLEAAKQEIEKVVKERDELINNYLLLKYSYIITSYDTVVYLSQTKELHIYDSTPTTFYKKDYGNDEAGT